MLSTIGEVLGPADRPRGGLSPSTLDDLAHRNALLVLDNLEQLTGADSVVAELLARAPMSR